MLKKVSTSILLAITLFYSASSLALLVESTAAFEERIKEVCVVVRDDMRYGHALFIGIQEDGDTVVSELNPGTPRLVFGQDTVTRRLSYFMAPKGFMYDIYHRVKHNIIFNFKHAAFCYELDKIESLKANRYFSPSSELNRMEQGEFNNFSNNCVHFIEDAFKEMTGLTIRTRRFSPLPTPRAIRKSLRRKRMSFLSLPNVHVYRNTDEVIALFNSLGLMVQDYDLARPDWFDEDLAKEQGSKRFLFFHL